MKALFEGLVDYAGLYPPAALSLPEAIANYRSYSGAEDSWMLSRFICGAAHVGQLSQQLLSGSALGKPLEISVVSRDPANELSQVKAGLPASVRVAAVEIALTAGLSVPDQVASHREALMRLTEVDHTVGVFYEVPFCQTWDNEFLRLVETLANEVSNFPGRILGCKLRCGGLEPHLVPSPERLGRALHACAQHSIAVKFTAGLHQPFRHIPQADETGSAGVPMHGYFNVYWAALAANIKALSSEEVSAIVAEMDECSPEVAPASIEWLGYQFSTQQISEMRSTKVLSFGSCSFDEPISAARQRGWV